MSVETLKALMGSGKVAGRLAGFYTVGATYLQRDSIAGWLADRSYCSGSAFEALQTKVEYGRFSMEVTDMVNCAVTNTPDTGEISWDLIIGLGWALAYNLVGAFNAGKELVSDGQSNDDPSGNDKVPGPLGFLLYMPNKYLDASVVGRIGVVGVMTAMRIAMPYALDRVAHMAVELSSYPWDAAELGDPLAALGLVAAGVLTWNLGKVVKYIADKF